MLIDDKTAQSIDLQNQKVLTFLSGDRWFCLPQNIPANSVDLGMVTPMPNSPPHYLGLVGLNDEILPVYSLAHLFTPALARSQSTMPFGIRVGEGDDSFILACEERPQSYLSAHLQKDPFVQQSEASSLIQRVTSVQLTLNGNTIHMLSPHALVRELLQSSPTTE